MVLNDENEQAAPRRVRRSIEDLGNSIVGWRKLRGLTQAQLAARVGIDRRTVMRLEKGDGSVSTENLFRILRALGVVDSVTRAVDPHESDLGRLRSDDMLPRRVRTKRFSNDA